MIGYIIAGLLIAAAIVVILRLVIGIVRGKSVSCSSCADGQDSEACNSCAKYAAFTEIGLGSYDKDSEAARMLESPEIEAKKDKE